MYVDLEEKNVTSDAEPGLYPRHHLLLLQIIIIIILLPLLLLEVNSTLTQVTSRGFILAITLFTFGYNFVKFFELTVEKVRRLQSNYVNCYYLLDFALTNP